MAEFDLSGKAAVVTGAGSGIGRATAHLFARAGCRALCLVDINLTAIEQVRAELANLPVVTQVLQADLTDPVRCGDVISEAAAAMGSVDIVLSNAGAGRPTMILDVTQEMWAFGMAINLGSHFFLAQAAARQMIAQGRGGALLFTCSGAAYGGTPGLSCYSAAKAGLLNLTKTFALELAGYGIRANSVSPGPTNTPLAEAQVGKEVFSEMQKALPVPLGRLADPFEVAAAFAFLASDSASYITGVDLPVDGGVTQFAINSGGLADLQEKG